ncbi:MAG: putative quinol monooxygenase [Reyranellaceae bacterium]
MILITGAILARPESFDELRLLCVAHSVRSRTEDGCLHHAVHVDAENPLRLVFVELWRDRAAVAAHFADQDARAFVKAARALAADTTRMAIYEGRDITAELLGR